MVYFLCVGMGGKMEEGREGRVDAVIKEDMGEGVQEPRGRLNVKFWALFEWHQKV